MIAVISITSGGYNLSKKIGEIFKTKDIYTLHPDREEDKKITLPLKSFTKNLFEEYDSLIFVMAVGITVRVVAPYIKDKTKDPAVLSIDEKGSFVVSILSGHIGGANTLTKKIAESIGAIPVITTASDVLDTKSVDMIAIEENLVIENMEDAKKITSSVVNGKKIGVYSSFLLEENLPKEYLCFDNLKDLKTSYVNKKIYGAVIIDIFKHKIGEEIPVAYLVPKSTILGIGCKKGKTKQEIITFIEETLRNLNIFEESVSVLATAWLKKHEEGIKEASDKFQAELKIFGKNQIKDVHDKFEKSEFVEKITGIKNVSDSCGYLASNNGENILRKTKKDGITLSIWRLGGKK
jgi:cobalt-precorrin 5A hydrolase